MMKLFDHRQSLLILGLALLLGTVFGTTLAALGVLPPAIIATFSCTDAQAARATTVFMLAMTCMQPVAGWASDRYSARRTMILGVASIIAGYILAARSASIGAFTATLAVVGAGVGSSAYVPASVVIAQCIDTRRGLAFAILMGGTAAGMALVPLLIVHGIERWGWRICLPGCAAAIAAVAAPVLFWLVKTPPPVRMATLSPAAQGGLRAVLHTPGYVLFVLQQALALLSNLGIYFFIVPYFTGRGFSMHAAVLVYGATSVAGLVGLLLFGLLADRRGARSTLRLGMMLSTLGITPLLVASESVSTIATLLFVVLWGTTSSLPSQLAPLLLADLTGTRHFGTLIGINSWVSGLAGAIAPLLIGQWYQMTGSYIGGFGLCAAALLLSVTLTMPLRIISSRLSLR